MSLTKLHFKHYQFIRNQPKTLLFKCIAILFYIMILFKSIVDLDKWNLGYEKVNLKDGCVAGPRPVHTC